jgi:hypothetical protein
MLEGVKRAREAHGARLARDGERGLEGRGRLGEGVMDGGGRKACQ